MLKKIAALVLMTAGIWGARIARADFAYRYGPDQVIRTGPFIGDEIVELQILAVPGNMQSANVISYDVTMSSFVFNPRFYIRTWNSAGYYDDVTPANNKDADLANTGLLNKSQTSFRAGPTGSYVRLGPLGTTILLSSTPSEKSMTYTDYQYVSQIEVTAGTSLSGTEVSTSDWTTLAVAVVPQGQEVVFSGIVYSLLSTDRGVPFAISPVVPEPASFAMLAIGIPAIACRRRQSKKAMC